LLLFGTVPIAAFGMWLTPLLFRLIFGRGFEAAATVASVLLLATPFLFLNSLFLNRAIALRQKRLYTTAQAGALVLGVLVALVAAPLRSGIAIAIAALVREVSLFVFLFSSSSVRARRAAA
jgi:O-antigen/teichoic acid export membrane protein